MSRRPSGRGKSGLSTTRTNSSAPGKSGSPGDEEAWDADAAGAIASAAGAASEAACSEPVALGWMVSWALQPRVRAAAMTTSLEVIRCKCMLVPPVSVSEPHSSGSSGPTDGARDHEGCDRGAGYGPLTCW